VIDDLASTDPWRPRGVEIRGRAEAIETPRALIRIHLERIISWGIDTRAPPRGPPIAAVCQAPSPGRRLDEICRMALRDQSTVEDQDSSTSRPSGLR